MAQRRYFNWKDEDSTRDLNIRSGYLAPAGRYAGFSFDVTTSGMLLKLQHTTYGANRVNPDATTATKVGVIVTKEGAVVEETDGIELPVNSNVSAFPRIDLVVLSHVYLEVVGGAAATYAIIQGTPAATPVAPALPNPYKEVIIGRLTLPAGTVAITAGMYVDDPIPSFGGDPYLARWTTKNNFFLLNNFYALNYFLGQGEIVVADNKIVPALAFFNPMNRQYLTADAPVTSHLLINTIEGWADISPAFNFVFISAVALKLSSTVFKNGSGKDIYIEAGSPFEIQRMQISVGQEWFVIQGSAPALNSKNKMRQLNQGSAADAAPITNFRLELANVANTGNMWTVDVDVNTIVRYVQSIDVAFGEADQGTVLVVNAEGVGWLTFEHDAGSVPTGFKPIFLPEGIPSLQIKAGSAALQMVETLTHWKLVLAPSIDADELTAATSPWVLVDVFDGAFMETPPATFGPSFTAGYRIEGNMLRLRGLIAIKVGLVADPGYSLLFELPATARCTRRLDCVVSLLSAGSTYSIAPGVSFVQAVLRIDEQVESPGGVRMNLNIITALDPAQDLWLRLDGLTFDLVD